MLINILINKFVIGKIKSSDKSDKKNQLIAVCLNRIQAD